MHRAHALARSKKKSASRATCAAPPRWEFALTVSWEFAVELLGPAPERHHHLRALAGDEPAEVRGPSRQSAPALVEIDRLVVDAGNAALMPTDMTKDDLDDVRR